MTSYKNQRAILLKWGSSILLVISLYIIYFGMNIIQKKVDRGEIVNVADHSKSDLFILFGSMLFGITGGMLTNIFTVYDNKYYDIKFDKLEEQISNLKI